MDNPEKSPTYRSKGCQLKNVPTRLAKAAYISERSRNSKKLKYDPPKNEK